MLDPIDEQEWELIRRLNKAVGAPVKPRGTLTRKQILESLEDLPDALF